MNSRLKANILVSFIVISALISAKAILDITVKIHSIFDEIREAETKANKDD